MEGIALVKVAEKMIKPLIPRNTGRAFFTDSPLSDRRRLVSRIFEDFPEKVLYANIQGGITKRALSPKMYHQMLSPLYTRTDVMASGFDKIAQAKKPKEMVRNRPPPNRRNLS